MKNESAENARCASVKEIWLRASCNLSFEVSTPTPMVFMLRPRSSERQWVAAQEYRLEPGIKVVEYSDRLDNLCQRLVAPVGDFHIHTSSDVLVSTAQAGTSAAGFVDVANLPDQALLYLLPSRYCESDRFGNMALEIVGDNPPGYAQVSAIVEWARDNIRYTPLSSTYPVSATEVNGRREGVCRDLSHICMALCRALCIPARMTVGYLHQLDPMDAHAWFEAFVGGCWHTFDPVFREGTGDRVSVAHGRDASDVAIYNQYGPMLLPTEMDVSVQMLDRAK